MCRIFEREKLWEKTQTGELELQISSNPINPPRLDYKGQLLVLTQDLTIVDVNFPEGHHRRDVAKAHRFITDEGMVGASGLTDPKDLMIGDINYRLLKERNPHCELCEGGDMIPPEERFHSSKYKPGALSEE